VAEHGRDELLVLVRPELGRGHVVALSRYVQVTPGEAVVSLKLTAFAARLASAVKFTPSVERSRT
jgi:hypothetical protein